MSKQYYQAGMNHFRRSPEIYGKTPIFIVASDDPKWCKKHLNATDVYFTETNGTMQSPQLDMAVLGNLDKASNWTIFLQLSLFKLVVIIQLYPMEHLATGQLI